MTVLTVLVVAAFIGLGHWQWQRGTRRSAQLEQFTSTATQAPLPLGSRGTQELPRWTRVGARGEYDVARQILLDNINYNGRPGYQVLTPLRLADGRVLLVDRGWLAFTGYRDRLPDVAFESTGAQEVSGRLDELPVAGLASGRAPPPMDGPWPRVTSFPTMAELGATLGEKLEPRMLLLDPEATGAGSGLTRAWSAPGMAPARHFAYAVQWWAMAAAVLVIFAVVNREKRA